MNADLKLILHLLLLPVLVICNDKLNSSGLNQHLLWSRIKCLRLNNINDPGCSRGHSEDNLMGPSDLELLPLNTFLQQKYRDSQENETDQEITLSGVSKLHYQYFINLTQIFNKNTSEELLYEGERQQNHNGTYNYDQHVI